MCISVSLVHFLRDWTTLRSTPDLFYKGRKSIFLLAILHRIPICVVYICTMSSMTLTSNLPICHLNGDTNDICPVFGSASSTFIYLIQVHFSILGK